MTEEKKVLVVYFSASGETARLARTIAQVTPASHLICLR